MVDEKSNGHRISGQEKGERQFINDPKEASYRFLAGSSETDCPQGGRVQPIASLADGTRV